MEVGSIDRIGAERTFLLSSTHGGEMCGLGAFLEITRVYEEENVCQGLWDYGARLKAGLLAIAAESGLEGRFLVEGPAISLNYVTLDASGQPSMKFRALFAQEMLRQGVMMPWIAVSKAHGAVELDVTYAAARHALRVYRQALEDGVERYLDGDGIKPVFRQFN
jgi:glutamate-1-semialdehyde 2,1-aminomutase